MMDCNPYYTPEKHNLRIVGVIEEELCYEFNMFVLWEDLTRPGLYLWGHDSGCSCPSPFEDHETNPRDTLTSGTLRDAQNDMNVWISNNKDGYNALIGSLPETVQRLLNSDSAAT